MAGVRRWGMGCMEYSKVGTSGGFTPLDSETCSGKLSVGSSTLRNRRKQSAFNGKRCPTGFTLVELLVTMVIFTIMILSLFTVFKVGIDSWNRRGVYSFLQADTRKAMERIERDIHQGDCSGAICANPGFLEFDVEMPDTTCTQVRYYLGGTDGTTLFRRVNAVDEVIANNVLAFTPVWDSSASPRVISIDMRTVRNDSFGQIAEIRAESQVTMRNQSYQGG